MNSNSIEETTRKLSEFEDATISPNKLKYALGHYLHNPQSVTKGQFFKRFGFDESSLKQTVIEIFKQSEVKNIRMTEYGVQFSKYAEVATPTGEIIRIGTGWILEPGSQQPRVTTITPA